MECGYKLTTNGQELLAACAALGEPLQLTRVCVGSGMVSEDTDLADVHELVSYVADGTLGERYRENNCLHLAVQYDNSAGGDAEGFTLSEFLVYAIHPETEEETDLLYATLGDARQPVPAYNASLPASIFSFPLVVVVSDEIEVSITASPGVVTHDDLQNLLNEGVIGVTRTTIIIPAAGWGDTPEEDAAVEEYPLCLDLEMDTITELMTPIVTIYPAYLPVARKCGMCQSARTMDGVLRLYAESAPAEDLTADLTLAGGAGYISISGAAVASATQLGNVMVGNGLSVTEEGVLSVADSVLTDSDLVDEDEVTQDVVNALNGDDT